VSELKADTKQSETKENESKGSKKESLSKHSKQPSVAKPEEVEVDLSKQASEIHRVPTIIKVTELEPDEKSSVEEGSQLQSLKL